MHSPGIKLLFKVKKSFLWIIPVWFLLIPVNLKGQDNELEILKQVYSEQDKNADQNDCRLKIIEVLETDQGRKVHFDQIILIRHGKPMISKNGLFSSYMAQEYLRNYDRVNVAPIGVSPVCLEDISPDTILTSNLQRSINTAEKLKVDMDIVLHSSPLYREFELEVFTVPFVRLPLNFWLVSSRLLWYAGLSSSTIENIRSSNHRIRYVAQDLEKWMEYNNHVVMVAHGLFNRRLARELKKRGWTLVYQNGTAYLNVKVLARISE